MTTNKITVYLRNCKMAVARETKTRSYETKGDPHWKCRSEHNGAVIPARKWSETVDPQNNHRNQSHRLRI